MKNNRSFFKTAGICNSILHVAIPAVGLLIALFVFVLFRVIRGSVF